MGQILAALPNAHVLFIIQCEMLGVCSQRHTEYENEKNSIWFLKIELSLLRGAEHLIDFLKIYIILS